MLNPVMTVFTLVFICSQIDQMSKLEPIKMDNFKEVQNYFLDKSIETGNFKKKFRNQK